MMRKNQVIISRTLRRTKDILKDLKGAVAICLAGTDVKDIFFFSDFSFACIAIRLWSEVYSALIQCCVKMEQDTFS